MTAQAANTPNDTPSDTNTRPMKRQVRVALVLFIAALALGWLGLRRGNAALEDAIATASAGSTTAGATGAVNAGGTP